MHVYQFTHQTENDVNTWTVSGFMIVVPVYLYQVILEKVPVWEYDLSVLIIVNIQPFLLFLSPR